MPPERVKFFTVEVPFSNREPPDTFTCPVVPPFSDPARVATPVPDTASEPPSVVVPNTVNEPPDTLRELLLLIVRAATESAPVVWVTAYPELIITDWVETGTVPSDQFEGDSHVRGFIGSALLKELLTTL